MIIIALLFLLKVGKTEDDYLFEHITTEDGLSHGSVSGMFKDKRGFMWFATWDGVNRYDGTTFKTYKTNEANTSKTSSNRVEFMLEDSFGNIWIITYDFKAYRLNYLSEKFELFPGEGFENDKITGIYPFDSGDVWLLTQHAGAYQVKSDTITNDVHVIHFHRNGDVSLPGNKVSFVFEDASSNVWLNTDGGLVCLQKESNSVQLNINEFDSNLKLVLDKHSITTSYFTSNKTFFGTQGYLLMLNNEDGSITEVELGNLNLVTDITGNQKGEIFIGTQGDGVFEFNIEAGEIVRHFSNENVLSVLNQFTDSHHQLWVETTLPGISKINLETGEIKHFNQKLDVNADIRRNAQCGFVEDENEVVWITLKGGGFGYYNRATDQVDYFFNQPDIPDSRISNFVNCFYKDTSGVLWMSTYFKGIEKVTFIKKKFNFVQPEPESNHSIANEVRAMMHDSKGRLWLATKKEELFIFDENNQLLTKFDKLNGEPIGRIYAFLEDSKGCVYFGTKGNGFYKLTEDSELIFEVQHFTTEPSDSFSISSNNIYDLIEDRGGRIWIATYGGGVNLFNGDRFLNARNSFKNFPLAKSDRVRCLEQDSNGNLWMGTTNGIVYLDANECFQNNPDFHYYANETAKGLLSTDILWILNDSSNNIWMASLGGGLAKYKGGLANDSLMFDVITKNDGLPSDVIFTIAEDINNKLWMSTENGISCYDPIQKSVQNYNRGDGLITSGFSEAAVSCSKSGVIYIGANNGFFSFDPNTFKSHQRKVNLVFTRFTLFGKTVIPGKNTVLKQSITATNNIELAYNQNVIGFNWASLEYTHVDKMQFACMLVGYDESWQFLGNRNNVSYSKIPPGKYKFMVRFTNPELQELNETKTIEIEIMPPFWQTTWAYCIYLILTILFIEFARRIITSMVQLRNRVVIEKEMTNIKLNFFTNISHELRTPLTLILGPIKALSSNENLSEKGRTYTEMIEQNTNRLLRLVNQLLDFRKIQSNKMKLQLDTVDLIDFIQKVSANYYALATEKNINFQLRLPSTSVLVSIDEAKMDSVLFNLLSNAFKFNSVGGNVTLELKIEGDKVQVYVQDNGCGISKEQEKSLFTIFASHTLPTNNISSGTGIGLVLSKELVELQNGELIYKPTEGGGATFIVQLNSTVLNDETRAVIQTKEILEQAYVTELSNEVLYKELPLILVVEDNSDLRKFLRLQLSENYRIEEAVNGIEGWTKAMNLQPDIILSDIMMPEMDGIQLLDKVKNTFETSHIPVVLLTAKTSVDSKIEGLRYGADAYLTKPFHSNQLLAQLENLLEQRSRLIEIFANGEIFSTSNVSRDVTNDDADFLNRVRKIIEENLSNSGLKIADVYNEVGMGRSKFFDKLKGLTGLSPVDFIRGYRLRRGKQLLQSGKYNVSETSYMTGFTDAGYFSKCYKEKYGISPSHELENR